MIAQHRLIGTPTKVISDLVGHASTAFTESVYGGKSAPEILAATTASLCPAVAG